MAVARFIGTFVVACSLVCTKTLAAQQPPTPPKPPVGQQQPPAGQQQPVTGAQQPVVTPTQPTAAEQAAAARGMNVSNDQIANAIKQSGLTQQQVRARLRSAGYDPSLADPFFASGSAPPGVTSGAGSPEFAKALMNLGILSPVTDAGTEAQAARQEHEGSSSSQSAVFGKDVFNRAGTEFDPITSGPVDASYRLGVGDVVQLVVTGQVELAYQLDVRRDGSVIIPQVGQIPIAGLTLDAARVLLRSKMAESYSGLSSGQAHLDLTVSSLRSNSVFVIGEVESPGALQVNALATVFHAIARAGGPTERGSFRDIEVRRGGQTIEHLDLYDYLLNGDSKGDIRLQQGDVIYVPLNTRVVAVEGAVRRPRIFQLKSDEGFADLLRFAGGFLPTASLQRVQIDRILPPDQRRPGFDRVKVDVDLKGNLDSLRRVKLYDGDVITVFDIGQTRRNIVQVGGQVFQPGDYEYRTGMTVDSLLAAAQGLLPWAEADRIKVIRQNPMNGRGELFSVDATNATGRAFPLEEFDSVEVLDSRVAYPSGRITIDGAVHEPAVRPYLEHETLRDAIERAGGFRENAQRVEVYRRLVHDNYSDSTTKAYQFALTPDRSLDSAASHFMLDRDDHIYVRSSPGFRAQRFVVVEGQFKYDGTYAINEDRDHVSDVVQRAGGVLPGAYAEGFQLIRQGKPVSIDFKRAIAGDRANNVGVLDGDTLRIERDPGTVLVTGAVSRTSLIQYRPGLSMGDYIDMAGGATEKGDAGKAVIDYPSGFSGRAKRVAWFFHETPRVTSGSTITVPEKPESTGTASELWTRLLASASALASIAIAYKAVTR